METFIRYTCNQCGHTWSPNTPHPKRCPNQKCQSPRWNKPKKIRRKKGTIPDLQVEHTTVDRS